MYSLRLISTFIKVNLQMSLAYRSEAISEIVLDLTWMVLEIVSLQIIFSNTVSLGGWGRGELIALLGVLWMVNTFMSALIWPNTEKFNSSVRDGAFDYMLLQPVNSMFLVSFSRITVWRLADLVIAIVLIAVCVHMAGEVTTPLNILMFALLTISGALVIYSLWIVLIAFTF